MWPSERGGRLTLNALGRSFTAFRQRAGLPPELSLHPLRHSYTTHLLEPGYDPLFVQQQLGHCYASTTALYTSVSSDFKQRVGSTDDRATTPNGGLRWLNNDVSVFTGICAV